MQAIHDMINRKRAGTDEEVIQFYKLIFGIKPSGNPECWTALEKSYQQRIATLEPQRLQTMANFLQDMNAYVQTLANTDWKQTDTLKQQMQVKGLQELHEDMHMGDIVSTTAKAEWKSRNNNRSMEANHVPQHKEENSIICAEAHDWPKQKTTQC